MYCTREGGYQYGELRGHGERITHGEFFRITEYEPGGVASCGRPVVIGVSTTAVPSWQAVNC